MKTSSQILADREVGQIPISIGTSLAIESLIGVLPEHETSNPIINKFDELWINIRTLIRNVIGAVPTEDKFNLEPIDIVMVIQEEIGLILDTVERYSVGRVKTTFYLCNFKSFLRVFKKSIPRYPKTERQKFLDTIEKHVIETFEKEEQSFPFNKYDVNIEAKAGKSLIISHQPVDLLSKYQFRQLNLLESHTGTVKSPSDWTSKLTGGKKLTRIPFNKLTLQLFGDGETFSTFPIKLKRELIDIAEKENWTQNTTMDKMRYGINKAYDPNFKILMFDLMK